MRGNYLYRKIGKKISFFRRSAQRSQEDLSLAAAIDRTYLARIEEGKANPTIKVLYKLAKELGVKVHDITVDV